MNTPPNLRTVLLRVVALALLLLLVLVGVLTSRTLSRVPDALVYFVRQDGNDFALEGVGRKLDGANREAHLQGVIRALAEGPSEAERSRGLSTALPEDTEVLGLRLEGRHLMLDLGRSIEAGGAAALMMGRLNQLYYSLTQPGYVGSVELRVEGAPVIAFGGEGLLLENPWRRDRHKGLPRW